MTSNHPISNIKKVLYIRSIGGVRRIMSIPEKEVKVEIRSVLGVASPFLQGGSMRMTIPKRMVKLADLKRKTKQGYFGYIFVQTDKGILLVPLDIPANPVSIGQALGFMDLTGMSKEDLEMLFEEE